MNTPSIQLPTSTQLFKKLTLFSSSNGLAQLMMAVYTLVVAGTLGPENYGFFIGSYSLVILSSFLINWGMDLWLLREASEQDAPGNLLTQVVQIKARLGLIWGLLLIVLPPLIFPEIFSFNMMVICVADVWCDSITNTFLMSLNAQKRLKNSAQIVLVSRALKLFGAIGLILVGVGSPIIFAAARGTATLISLLFAALIVHPILVVRVPSVSLRLVWRRSIPYGLSEFLAIIYLQADVTLLSLIAGKTAAGYYAPASSLINALFVIPNTIYLTFLPYLVNLLPGGNTQSLRKVLRWLFATQLVLGFVMALGVGLLGGPTLEFLLRKEYATAGLILTILSPILFFKALNFGFAAWIVAIGWQRYRVWPQAVVAFGCVLANLWAIPRFGIYGAAWIYTVGEFILLLGYGYVSWQGWKRVKAGNL